MKIKIEYQTGDSFSRHDEIDYLSLEWENREVAKENLQRIKDHYEHHEFVKSSDYRNLNKASRDSYRRKCKKKEWYRSCGEGDDGEFSLILKTDEGKDFVQQSFWTGYFERLYSASIEDEEERVSFN